MINGKSRESGGLFSRTNECITTGIQQSDWNAPVWDDVARLAWECNLRNQVGILRGN